MIVNGWLELSEADGVPFDVLKSRLEVPNPEYTSAMRMGFSTAGMHRFDPLYEEGHDAVGNKVLYVPRALVTKYGRGKKVVDRTSSGLPVKFNLKVQLGPTESRSEDQTSFVDALVDALQKNGGAIGQAAPGYGKTLCSLAIAARLGVTTAVLVHKGFLMDQWVERITEALDVTPDEIGRVQQGVCDFKGKKIVLIMAQSLLSSRQYPDELFSYFGLVIVDEVHRFGAVEFRKTITMFPAKYRLGVSATPKRKDGLDIVFLSHIGEVAFVGSKSKLVAKIRYFEADMAVTDLMLRNMLNYRREFDLVKVTSQLVTCDTRNRQIARLLVSALKSGRKVMLLSSRREHLTVLASMFEEESRRNGVRFAYGYYVGGMDEQDLRISATRQLILATFQMAQEGLDIPDLDTLVLATPKGDIVQAVGRILRKCADKKEPIVVDLLDSKIRMCQNLAQKRARQYREMGCVFAKNSS